MDARQPLTEDELNKLADGVDPNDLGRPFDAEELALIDQLRAVRSLGKGPAFFSRGDQYARNRREPRGDRRIDHEGKKVGPAWKDKTVFKDEDCKVVDLEATRYERAKGYLVRRQISGNRFSNFKKLGRAARILG